MRSILPFALLLSGCQLLFPPPALVGVWQPDGTVTEEGCVGAACTSGGPEGIELTISQTSGDEYLVEGYGCAFAARTKTKEPLVVELAGAQSCKLPKLTSYKLNGLGHATGCALQLTLNEATFSVTSGILSTAGRATITPDEGSCTVTSTTWAFSYSAKAP